MIGHYGQAGSLGVAYSGFFSKPTGKQMKKYVLLIVLALVTMAGAVLEGLVENLSPQMVQLNGLFTLISASVLIGWALSVQEGNLSKD